MIKKRKVQDSVASATALTDEDKDVLKQELELVQILHHRNRNQHRSAVWYRHLSFLKSILARLLAITGANSSDEQNRQREQFVKRVPTIYTAFSRIIGTGQYVAIGMVLIGILSRSWKIITGQESSHHATSSEDEDMAVMATSTDQDVDYGQVVSRGESQEQIDMIANASSSALPGISLKSDTSNTYVKSCTVVQSSHADPMRRKKEKVRDKSTAARQKKRRRTDEQVDEIDAIFG